MTRATTAVVLQELRDFKEFTKEKLESIEVQTKKTNGRVNGHDSMLAVMAEQYNSCPARELVKFPNKMAKWSNLIAAVSAIIAFMSMLIMYVTLYGGI